MAIYKKVAKSGKYQDDLAIPNLIVYITRADKAKSGMIGGSNHAYPDVIAMTTSGKILMIEPKGDRMDSIESKEKAKIGHQWTNLAGSDSATSWSMNPNPRTIRAHIRMIGLWRFLKGL